MLNQIMDILDKGMFNFVVSVVGLALSIFNFIYLLYTNKRNFCLRIRDWYIPDNLTDTFITEETIAFEAVIENKSRVPLSVSHMQLLVFNCCYEFQWVPQLCYQSLDPLKNPAKEEYSIRLPIDISGVGSVGGYFVVNVAHAKDLDVGSGKIKVFTTRGAKTFSISGCLISEKHNCCAETDNYRRY